MSKDKSNCQIEDDCSKGTCAPVSPFSRQGLYLMMFIILLFFILFIILFINGYLN